MADICILPEFIDDIEKVMDESPDSLTRLAKLTDLFGGNAKSAQEINKLFETKLLLKNQSVAMDRFIESIDGIGAQKKAELREAIQRRMVDRTEKIQDDELLSIAKDIFDKKYDLDLKPTQVKELNKFKREVYNTEQLIEGTPSGSPERIANAKAQVAMSDYVDYLINPTKNQGLIDTVKTYLKETGQKFEGKTSVEKVLESGKLAADVLTSPIYKSVQASMDVSYALRQGYKVFARSPKIWLKSLKESFKPFTQLASPEDKWRAMEAFKIELASKEMYKEALDSKLAIGVIEEFFPTTFAEKIPLIGRVFKASNEAFTIFSQGSRMRMFEDMVKHAQGNGTEITSDLMKEFAMLANSISGRGSLGSLEKIPSTVNKVLFSGRFIKSQLDTFYLPFKPDLSPTARKIAMAESVKAIGMMGTIMATAAQFTDVEFDPRSSKFGKMKLPGSKDVWIDITGGLGSYITLASRIATQKSKSANTGKVRDLNTGEFGSQTTWDVFMNWAGNKLAPAPSAIRDYLKGETFGGEELTAIGSVKNLLTPITISNALDLFGNEDTATAFISTMFDALGAAQTDYSQFK